MPRARSTDERAGEAAPQAGSTAPPPGRAEALRAAAGRRAGHLGRALVEAARGYSRHLSAQLAAAISYHVLFSLFPLAIATVAVAGLVLRDAERRQGFTEWLLDRVPLADEAGLDLAAAIDELARPVTAAGLLGLLGLLWSASGMMAAIRRGLDAAFTGGAGRPIVQGKLVDLALVLVTALAIAAALGLTVLGQLVERLVGGPAALDEALRVLGPLALAFAAISLLYRHLPLLKPAFASLWPGALLAAAAFQLVSEGFSLYLANVRDFNLVYGSIGAALAFLVVVYAVASAFLFGAEVAAAWPRTREPGPPGEDGDRPVRERLLGALKGLVIRGSDDRPDPR